MGNLSTREYTTARVDVTASSGNSLIFEPTFLSRFSSKPRCNVTGDGVFEMSIAKHVVLLMEEILHHLGYIKPCK